MAFSAAAADPGAKIDESKVVHTYYIDPAGADSADDDHHGTQDSPFLTLKHALAVALHDKDANIGAKVIIASGTYRDPIILPAPPGDGTDTEAPLVIEGAEHNQAILDCANTDGWEAPTWKPDGKTLTHPWPFDPAHAAAANAHRSGHVHVAETTGRPELLLFNAAALREVDGPGALVPGSFCIVRSADRKGSASVRVMTPAGEEENASNQFAVGVRPYGLLATRRRNIVVRGLLFQHAANSAGEADATRQSGLVFEGCSNVLIEDVLSQWNNDSGLVFEGAASAPWSTGLTLRRVQLIHNGGVGLAINNVCGVLAEDCETSFNSFRDEWAAHANPDGAAGVKAHGMHGSTWRRQRAIANFARGLWWSGDCTDLVVEDAVVRDNLFSGLFVENCTGPTSVRGSLVSDNKMLAGSKPEASEPAGISIEASPDVTLENNVIASNAMPQLGIRDVAERTDSVNFETGAKLTLRAERHAYRHNVFYGAKGDQTAIALPAVDRSGKGDFAFYFASLDSDENCFWNPAATDVFCTFDRMNYRKTSVALAGWRTFLATRGGGGERKPESGSLWEDPKFMEPAEGDYRLQAESPLIDWGLPAEEGGAAQ